MILGDILICYYDIYGLQTDSLYDEALPGDEPRGAHDMSRKSFTIS